jgi:TRAP-type C4-dicarboxylate transport system substrate-binding protein
MPVPAVPESLSKGVLNGTTIPWEVTTSLKVPDLVENHTEFEGAALYTLTFIMAMNRDVYNSLPDDLKAVIDTHSGLEFSVFAGRTQSGQDGPARELAIDNGNNIITLKGDKVAEWQQAVEPIYARWIADMNEKGLDGAGLVAEARARQDSCLKQFSK